MATLRFDQEQGAKHALKDGRFAIVPGDPARSQMIARITATNPAVRMPRSQNGAAAGEPLSERQVALLTRWIEQGATWQKHWSFIPPKRPELPKDLKDAKWVRNPIDAFVLQRLEREGLKPSAEADKATLLRRVSLDLTGLPPTPAELDAFLADTSPNAYEKVVDRLLRSPQYGERMAFPWLDAARYADSNGYQTDGERFMWRWRDWVIDAFNRNMPYDQFTIEQLAGDLLPNATLNQKIATGFNRNHRGNSEGGIVPEEYAAEYVVDRVDTTSTVFLGLTVGCARCHNHKFDPFTQKEFYQLFAYFNNVPEHGKFRRVGNSPPYIAAPLPEQEAQLKRLDDELAAASAAYAKLQPDVARAQREWERSLDQSTRGGLGAGPRAWSPTTHSTAISRLRLRCCTRRRTRDRQRSAPWRRERSWPRAWRPAGSGRRRASTARPSFNSAATSPGSTATALDEARSAQTIRPSPTTTDTRWPRGSIPPRRTARS